MDSDSSPGAPLRPAGASMPSLLAMAPAVALAGRPEFRSKQPNAQDATRRGACAR